MNISYDDFIFFKMKTFKDSGFEPEELNQKLFPFQVEVVKRALKKGRYAIFADCGLGKTLMQLSWAESVSTKTNSKVLILAPLAVVAQTQREAAKFGIDLSMIDIINYEQIKNIENG